MDSTARRPRAVRRVWKGLGVGAGLLAVVTYTAISLFTADLLTRPSNHPPRVDPWAVSPDAVAWSTETADGLTLRGWYYPTPHQRRLIVLVHGLWGSWDDMAGLGHDLHARGYDVLLFDLRGHGQSDPSRVTMGRRERGDLRAALAWAQSQGFPPDRVGWVGQSMGGSTLLMEGVENPDLRVLVLDSPYGNLPQLLDSQLTQHSHLPRLFNPGILLAAHRAYGVRTDDLVPIRTARRWDGRPLLLIHGEADSIVPIQQARALARAAGPACRTRFLPGVEHVAAYRDDPESYLNTLDQFFNKYLEP